MAKTSGGIRYTHSSPSADFKEFRAYSRDWENTYFSHETGGYVVTDKDRIKSSKSSPNEEVKYKKEREMSIDLAEQGHKIEHLSDKNRKKRDTYDILFDGSKTDLKSTSSHNNIEKYVRHAVRDQGANVVIIRIENGADRGKVLSALKSAKRKYGRRIVYYYQSDKTIREL